MMMHISKRVAAVLVLATVSACSPSVEGGSPTPVSPPNSSSASESTSKLPARPSSLKLDSVDACKLLTADQMAQLQTVATRSVKLPLVDGAESPSCHYRSEDSFTYTVGAVTHNGVSYWLEGGNFDTKVIEVADFGAIEIQLKAVSGFDCSVAIDVADGQQLMVSYIPTSAKKPAQSVVCGNAEKAAGLALATLKTLK